MPQRPTLLWAIRTNMAVGVVVVGLCSLDSARPCSAPNSGLSSTLLTALLVALLSALLCCRTNQIRTGLRLKNLLKQVYIPASILALS